MAAVVRDVANASPCAVWCALPCVISLISERRARMVMLTPASPDMRWGLQGAEACRAESDRDEELQLPAVLPGSTATKPREPFGPRLFDEGSGRNFR